MTGRQRWTLLVVSITAFMLLLDLTIVTVALADIQHALGASFDDLQWVVDAYALTLAAFLLTAGALADRLGRRSAFLCGLAVFTLGSLACGLAGSSWALIVARGVQGVGGAVLLAAGPALIAQEFALGPARDRAFAAFGGAAGLAIATGPLIGGALTTASWRWIFLVNLPVGVLCAVFGATRLRDVRAARRVGVDWPGAGLLCVGLFLLTYALMRGQADGWGSATIIGCLAGCCVALAAFALRESRTPAPLIDPRLFRSLTFCGLSAATLVAYVAIFPGIFFCTLYLQEVLGYSPFGAGVRMLPLTGAIFAASALAAPLSGRLPARVLLSAGLALTGAGLLLIHGLSVTSPWTALLLGSIVCGFGVGVFNVVRAETTVSLVPAERSGEASGVGSTFQEVGVALGIAVLGALFQHRASLTGSFRAGFVSGLNEVLLVAGIVALVGAALTAVTVRHAPTVPPKPAPTPAEAVRPIDSRRNQ